LVRRDVELFLISVLMLFLELVLIRWIGTEARIFAYLGNLILVACFFGAGMGCYLASRPVAMTHLGMNLLVLTVIVANPFRLGSFNLRKVTDWLARFEDSPVWEGLATAPGLRTVAGLMFVGLVLYLVVFLFIPIGQALGRSMQDHPRVIRAYSFNIGGSLAGIWLFNALSHWATPPVVWFLVCAALIAAVSLLIETGKNWVIIAAAVSAAIVWWGQPRTTRTVWSPYQKLTIWPLRVGTPSDLVPCGYFIEANNTGYQQIVDLSRDFTLAHPRLFDPEIVETSHYNMAMRFRPGARRVLILGAGSGGNAAGALRHGAEQVDCVEIDPRIYELGKELHPERPYDSPRVRMFVDDARSFLKQATGTYDLIWFALLDTHPGSAYNNVRLDHYVYTMQSLREAKRLLAPDGVLVMNFGARRLWIADRLWGMVRDVFEQEPLSFFAGAPPPQYGSSGEFTLVTANRPFSLASVANPSLREYIASHSLREFVRSVSPSEAAASPFRDRFFGITRPTTDDWPFLYLQTPRIPKLHLVTMLTLMATVFVAGRQTLGLRSGLDAHFAALGAAFLLLEVQTVSRATLLFGTTWVVNAIVISAALVMILCANLVALQWPRCPQILIIGGLAVTVSSLALVPLDWFNALSLTPRIVVASAFLTAPIFFAGLIFIRSFASCPDKPRALGSNLVGALVGGLLESVAYVTGIRALVVLVAVFYTIALLRRPHLESNAGASPA
jgi:spermidine synthase